jgi:ABC-type transport system involved in cytochrome bd biosynthesis fused ATPase/permease subunit
MLLAAYLTIKNFVLTVFDLIKSNSVARYTFMMLVFLIVIFLVVLARYCSDSRTEKNIQQIEQQVTEVKSNTTEIESKNAVQENVVSNRKSKVAELEKKSAEIKRENKGNVSFSEANRLRCEVYPEDSGCR